MTISVLLVDGHRLVREALRDALAREPDIQVVGEADDAATAFERARSLVLDAVVVGDSLPDMKSAEAAARLKRGAGFDSKIVALSMHVDRRFVTEMLRAGVSAYVTKSSALSELVQAIRAVVDRRTYLCPEVAGGLASIVRSDDQNKPEARLSGREREVLRLIAEGIRSQPIADRLHISVGTVEVHRRNIMRKLGVRTVADLTRYAIREGLIRA